MADGIGGVTTTEAESLDTRSPRHEWKRGWKVVAVSLLSYVFGSTGMFYAFGIFLKPLSSEFQWSRAAISGFWSISGVIFGLASPIVGRLADRFGVRRVILISVILVALICGPQSLLTRHLCPRSFVGRGHRGHHDAHLREGHFELVRPKPRLGALNVILRRRTGRSRHASVRAVTHCPLWMARSVLAFFMGRVFDVYHSYVLMTNIIAAASIVAAALFYLLPKTSGIPVTKNL